MDIKECMGFINSYSKSGGRITDLSRAQELMEHIGEPEKKLRFIHIAGTNGKGSTVEYISGILINAGYRTGQFTSPFILRYNDRIRINGAEISDSDLCRIAAYVKERVSDRPYSQFEITMAIAMLWYLEQKCDVVVLETGIGGLLDSTNVIPPPLLSVITSVSLDHTSILGDTVEKIAAQKAGIIKPGSAVLLSIDNPESVREAVRKTADSTGAEFIAPSVRPEIVSSEPDGVSFTYNNTAFRTSMPGEHQAYNAVSAIEACRYLRTKGFIISEDDISAGISSASISARQQFIPGEPPVLVDGGHNPGGVSSLAVTLRAIHRTKRIYAVLGMVDSKDYRSCAGIISGLADKVYTVDGFAYNSVPAGVLAESLGSSAEACGSLAEAVEKAKRAALNDGGIVVVCGSLYLASEYLNNFQQKHSQRNGE